MSRVEMPSVRTGSSWRISSAPATRASGVTPTRMSIGRPEYPVEAATSQVDAT